MNSEQQKKVLKFVQLVETLRKYESDLDKAIKERESMKANDLKNKITMTKMSIDRDLPDTLKICRVEQLKLGL